MKTAIISMFVLFALISVSSFALPSPTDIDCILDCEDEFDHCDQACGARFSCDVCDSDLELCREKC